MLKFIFYLLFIYLVYRIVKFFFRSVSSRQNTQSRQNRTGNSKYDNVEDAKYIEIETERNKQAEKNSSEEK